MPEEDCAQLRAVIEDCKGNIYPACIIPSPDRYEAFYGHFGATFSASQSYVRTEQPGSIDFVEQIRAQVQS
jgi:hypothetical protein